MNILSRFFAWWFAALRAVLPNWMSDVIFGPSGRIEVSQTSNQIAAHLFGGKIPKELFTESTEQGITAAAKKRLRRLSRLSHKSVTLRMRPIEALVTKIQVPVSFAENLRQAVAAEIDRFTPFNRDDVYFDFAVTSVDTDLDVIRMQMLVAQKTDVNRMVDLAKSSGLKVTGVSGPRTEAPETDMLNLLPEDLRSRPSKLLSNVVRVLAGVALILVTANAALLYTSKKQRFDLSQQRIADLRSTALEASDLEDRLSEIRKTAQLIGLRKATSLSVVDAIGDVTKTLNEEHWLASLEIKQGTIAIAGFSKKPTAMLRLLDRSDKLTNARFTAPVTRNEQTGQNRFFASVDLVQKAQD